MAKLDPNIDVCNDSQPLKSWITETLELLFVYLYPFLMLMCTGLYIALATLPTIGLPLALAYLAFMIFDKAPENCGRRSQWLIDHNPVMSYLSNYFNLQIHRETELDPTKNYIFAYHPHGIISFGFQCAIYGWKNNLDKLFPGIQVSLSTLNMNFYIPFYRECILLSGVNNASKTAIKTILASGPGKSVGLVVGGAAEALYAKPNLARLVIKKRMGFVKIAIQTGADLVPMYSFGENCMFDIEESNSGIYNYIKKFNKTVFGTTTPLISGRGFKEGSKGLFPYKVPINIVIGAPIKVVKNENPTVEEVQQVHQQYLKRLMDLYNRNKDKYHPGGNPPELEFVDH